VGLITFLIKNQKLTPTLFKFFTNKLTIFKNFFIVIFLIKTVMFKNIRVKSALKVYKLLKKFKYNRHVFNKKYSLRSIQAYFFKRQNNLKIYKYSKRKLLSNLNLVSDVKQTTLSKYIYNSFSLRFFLLFLLTALKYKAKNSLVFFYKQYLQNFLKNNYLTVKAQTKLWTNVLPSAYLPKSIRSAAIKKQFFKKSQGYSIFLRQYLGGFFESLTDRKIFIKIKPHLSIPRNIEKFISLLAEEFRPLKAVMGKNFYIKEMMLVC
jgi:hypothetical protein